MRALIDFAPGGAQLLDARGTVDHLVARGLISAETLVSAGVTVTDRSSRCRTYVVRTGPSGFVVKQGTNSETVQSVRDEAATYSRLGSVVPVPCLRSFRDGCLVTDWVPGSTLAGSIERDPRAHAARAPELAGILARLHGSGPDPSTLPPARPSAVFLLARPPLAAFQFHSHGSHLLTRLIQADEMLTAGLLSLSSRWRASSQIHNDVRPENIIETPGGGLVVIDWELAGRGDPRWDLGALVAGHVIAFLEDADVWARPAADRHRADRLGALHAVVRRVLDAYQEGGGCVVPPVDLVQWVAGRMVLTTMERCSAAPSVSAACRHLLQVAANLFRRPEAGAQIFLGVRQP
ncbi:aminoglycoside phosphotransferase family protein [Actinoplanes sp. RD1]|uniref:aminoglycoside phosphotransferase family protein n=1 Tax=Actinoplanes sp. RD1 TaxID=3064538 RepID=UPI0027428050|nr:aminoglycoside phosphotransferase family protein [Actinoplanes sp. RD1]